MCRRASAGRSRLRPPHRIGGRPSGKSRQRPALEQTAAEADSTAAAQNASADALEQQAAAARAALPYPQRAEAQAALDALEASRTALRTGMEQAQHSLKQAEQAYAAAKAAVDALQTQQATAETAGPAQPLEFLQAEQARLAAAALPCGSRPSSWPHSCCPTALRQKNTAQPLPPAPSWNSAGSG